MIDQNTTSGFRVVADVAPNLPRRPLEIDVEFADTAGRRDRIRLVVPPPIQVDTDPIGSTYTGYRLPLAAFDVDPAALASVAVIARERCELAIDHVDLVARW